MTSLVEDAGAMAEWIATALSSSGYRADFSPDNDADPQGEVNIELQLPDGSVIWPVQRAMKRLANGPEEGIAAYAAALGFEVGRAPGR